MWNNSGMDVRLDTGLELLLERAPGADASRVLATVVATAGSTYRKPGARMLLMADGSYIGLLSGGSIAREDIKEMEEFKKHNRLVFISYGSHEVGGGGPRRGGDPQANVEALKSVGINAHYYVSPKTGHEWQSWRRSLREFAPLLFQR